MSELVSCTACHKPASAWFVNFDGEEIPLCLDHQPPSGPTQS